MTESHNGRGRVVGVAGSAGSLAALKSPFDDLVTSMSSGARPVATRWDPAHDLGAVPVTAVMSQDVLVVKGQDPIIEVAQRMHDLDTPVAVVCDDSRMVAVVSQRTLALWWPSGGPREMRRRRIRDVIDPGTPIVHPHTTVRQAAELINDFQVEGVPVVAAGGALLGLVTPTELVCLLANPPDDSVTAAQG